MDAAMPLHAFLSGTGTDGAGRSIETVLGLPDGPLERIHDYIQWLFPLATRSMAQPGAPVLSSKEEIAAIRRDPRAQANLHEATGRMLAFFRDTDDWLAWSDHNHLRISRIIKSLRLLVDDAAARSFHDEISRLVAAAGSPVDPRNRRYWSDALEE